MTNNIFDQINIRPTISKKRYNIINNLPELPNGNFFQSGEEGVTSLFTNANFSGLYLDSQATTQNTANLQNVGAMLVNSGIDTFGFNEELITKKPVVNVEGNIRYIEFDGVDDNLTGTVQANSFFSNGTSNCHGFSIAFKHVSGRGLFRWSHPRMSSTSRGFGVSIVGTTLYLYANNWTNTAETFKSVTNFSATSWCVLTGQVDYATGVVRMWKNGTLIKTDTTPTGTLWSSTVPVISQIARNPEYGGIKLAKICFWRNPLNDTAITRVINDMCAVIGVTP